MGDSEYVSIQSTWGPLQVLGTWGYVAPEYATAERVGEKADVFSFGVVMLEILSGRKPFGDVDLVDLVSLPRAHRPIKVREEMSEIHIHIFVHTYIDTEMHSCIWRDIHTYIHLYQHMKRQAYVLTDINTLYLLK